MIDSVTHTQAWRLLERHYEEHKRVHLRDLFAADLARFENFSVETQGLLFDYSKQRVTAETLRLLLQLAEEVDLRGPHQRTVCRGTGQQHRRASSFAHGITPARGCRLPERRERRQS